MMRRGISAAIAAIGLGIMASAGMAGSYLGQVDLSWTGPGHSGYSSGYGGEFNVTLYYSALPHDTVAPQASAVYISPQAGAPSNLTGLNPSPTAFQTFCIQAGNNDVTFNPGTYYAGVIETTAYNFHSSPNNTQTLTPLTRTLYAMFSDGTLAADGYDYNLGDYNSADPEGVNRSTSAGELQAAIWLNQGDFGAYNSLTLLAEEDAALAEANLPDTSTYTDQVNTYLGITPGSDPNYKRVEILGLYDTAADAVAGGPTGIAQAQLVEVVPLPRPIWEASVLLGGLVLVQGWNRRRLAARS